MQRVPPPILGGSRRSFRQAAIGLSTPRLVAAGGGIRNADPSIAGLRQACHASGSGAACKARARSCSAGGPHGHDPDASVGHTNNGVASGNFPDGNKEHFQCPAHGDGTARGPNRNSGASREPSESAGCRPWPFGQSLRRGSPRSRSNPTRQRRQERRLPSGRTYALNSPFDPSEAEQTRHKARMLQAICNQLAERF